MTQQTIQVTYGYQQVCCGKTHTGIINHQHVDVVIDHVAVVVVTQIADGYGTVGIHGGDVTEFVVTLVAELTVIAEELWDMITTHLLVLKMQDTTNHLHLFLTELTCIFKEKLTDHKVNSLLISKASINHLHQP